jgi:hypothetical protein
VTCLSTYSDVMVARRFAVVVLAGCLLACAAPSLASQPSLLHRSATTTSARATTLDKVHPRKIELTRWGPTTVRRGTFEATRVAGGIVIGRNPTSVRYRDPYGDGAAVRYERGRWYSPWHRPGFGLTELIASYNATTPVGTFIETSVRGRTARGTTSSWDSLGRWASHDTRFHRMSLGSQPDDSSSVAVDTLITDDGVSYPAWQLRVSLYRKATTTKTPIVTMIGAMASRLPDTTPRTSRPGPGRGIDLAVPRYSQMIHTGEYPQWNGGGEAWCSPTSTSMVLAYWDAGPTPKQYAWVKDGYRQPWVDYAARYTFAWGYDGTGMWPFNTAYAGRFDLDAFVTRLGSLREAELFIRAGIPVVASISFDNGELDGAPIGSTDGHLLVIRGFTDAGKVIVNDPAASSAKGVKRTYKRGQFERAWIGSTGGVAYIIHPDSQPLPEPGRHANW